MLIATAVSVAAIAGCSDDRASTAADRTATTAIAADDDGDGSLTDPKPPEMFRGEVDDFYVVPEPLPRGEPGSLIRVQELDETDGVMSVRVMYHSRDAEERDRAVTGVISYPTSAPPVDGWPVVSWAHGTTGLVSACAPSRNGGAAPGFGVEGVRVATDYIGLGPVGEVHPYLSGPSEGNSVIDAVRAARLLPDAHAGKRWLAVGHSQGGHSALFAGERAEPYAPELELLGTVSFAPAAELDKTYGPVDEVVARVVGIMALYGAAAEHPDLDFAAYAGPEVEAAADVFESGCLDEIIPAVAGIPADTFYEADPLKTDPAKSILDENNPGQVAAGSPLFVVSGTVDDRVTIGRVRDLFDRLCAIGQTTELLVVEGANHGDVIGRTTDQVETWLADRIAGRPAEDSCE